MSNQRVKIGPELTQDKGSFALRSDLDHHIHLLSRSHPALYYPLPEAVLLLLASSLSWPSLVLYSLHLPYLLSLSCSLRKRFDSGWAERDGIACQPLQRGSH